MKSECDPQMTWFQGPGLYIPSSTLTSTKHHGWETIAFSFLGMVKFTVQWGLPHSLFADSVFMGVEPPTSAPAHPLGLSSKPIKLPGLTCAVLWEAEQSQSKGWRTFPIQGERDQAGEQSWLWETLSAGRWSWSSMWAAHPLDKEIFPWLP